MTYTPQTNIYVGKYVKHNFDPGWFQIASILNDNKVEVVKVSTELNNKISNNTRIYNIWELKEY